jgi:hypothetical protein
MLSPAQRLVVLGLIGCLAGLDAAQAPVVPSSSAREAGQDSNIPACTRVDGPGESVSLIGLTDQVSPAHAPIPTNDSERLLFRHVYDTLVHTDCDSVRPGLAASWQLDGAGITWIIHMRRDARFSDGLAVTARDVIASWTLDGSALRPEVARFILSATAPDEGTLFVVLKPQANQERATPVAPDILAQPALAIARFAPGSPWPFGTRDVRLDSPATSSSGRTTITLVPTIDVAPSTAPPATSTTPPAADGLRFLVWPNRDARDLLDQGVDLVVTRDPAALAYANVLGQFESIPLPWLRSYVFVGRNRVIDATLAPEPRQQLATDAVSGEARGSSLDWDDAWHRCTSGAADAPRASELPATSASAPRLAFDQADPVARSLAERIGVLASRPGGNQILDVLMPQARSRTLQMVPLRERDLSSALARGEHAGFVIGVDSMTNCEATATLQERAPWLTPRAVVPLVDTRLRALLRKGRSHMTIARDGTVIVDVPVRSQ